MLRENPPLALGGPQFPRGRQFSKRPASRRTTHPQSRSLLASNPQRCPVRHSTVPPARSRDEIQSLVCFPLGRRCASSVRTPACTSRPVPLPGCKPPAKISPPKHYAHRRNIRLHEKPPTDQHSNDRCCWMSWS